MVHKELREKDPPVLFAAAAAAASLQSCLTLCDPIDGSPPGSPIPGILQARTLEWVAISFSNAWKWKVKVKSLSCIWLVATPWTAAPQASLSFSISPEFTQIHVHWVSDAIYHFILCPSLLILPSIFPSIRVFSNWAGSLHQVAKVLEFQTQHQSSNEYSGLISFRMDWFDLLVVQGTLKSLLQQCSSKASILQHWAFFMVQLTSKHN